MYVYMYIYAPKILNSININLKCNNITKSVYVKLYLKLEMRIILINLHL